MLAEHDAKEKLSTIPNNIVAHVVFVISQYLSDIKYGKKYMGLLEMAKACPDIKFYKLNTFSSTRFAAYSHLVMNAFLTDIKTIVLALENRALEENSNGSAVKLLRLIANKKFLLELCGLCDVYYIIGTLCTKLQKVNLN